MAKFVRLSKRDIREILSREQDSCSDDIVNDCAKAVNLRIIKKIVKKYSKTNRVLLSTAKIRDIVNKCVKSILRHIVVEDDAELKALAKLEAWENDPQRFAQSVEETRRYMYEIYYGGGEQ